MLEAGRRRGVADPHGFDTGDPEEREELGPVGLLEPRQDGESSRKGKLSTLVAWRLCKEHATEIQRRHGYRGFRRQPEHFRLVRWLYTACLGQCGAADRAV